MSRTLSPWFIPAHAVCLFAIGGPSSADDPKLAAPNIDLNVGDLAPTFQLKDDKNKTWSASDQVGKNWAVIYFYPCDFTQGYTAQAKAFNEAMDKLTEKGFEVVDVHVTAGRPAPIVNNAVEGRNDASWRNQLRSR